MATRMTYYTCNFHVAYTAKVNIRAGADNIWLAAHRQKHPP